MRLQRLTFSSVAVAAAMSIGLFGAPDGAASQQSSDVRVRDRGFEWIDADGDIATFTWQVEVINDTDQEYRVQVILELLDDDDRVINRDEQGINRDFVTVTLKPRTRQTVGEQGQLPYDRAAELVSYRHRRELSAPGTD